MKRREKAFSASAQVHYFCISCLSTYLCTPDKDCDRSQIPGYCEKKDDERRKKVLPFQLLIIFGEKKKAERRVGLSSSEYFFFFPSKYLSAAREEAERNTSDGTKERKRDSRPHVWKRAHRIELNCSSRDSRPLTREKSHNQEEKRMCCQERELRLLINRQHVERFYCSYSSFFISMHSMRIGLGILRKWNAKFADELPPYFE